MTPAVNAEDFLTVLIIVNRRVMRPIVTLQYLTILLMLSAQPFMMSPMMFFTYLRLCEHAAVPVPFRLLLRIASL